MMAQRAGFNPSPEVAVLRRVVEVVQSGGPRSPYMEVLTCGHRKRQYSAVGMIRQSNWRRCDPCSRAKAKANADGED